MQQWLASFIRGELIFEAYVHGGLRVKWPDENMINKLRYFPRLGDGNIRGFVQPAGIFRSLPTAEEVAR
jgi:hypothetical protein